MKIVNAVIWGFIWPKERTDRKLAVSYLRQMHYIYGFEKVFVSKEIFLSINNIFSADECYLKPLTDTTETEKDTLETLSQSLNSVLWKINKTDAGESGLGTFLDTYHIWLKARTLKSLIVVPLMDPANTFSALINSFSKKLSSLKFLFEDFELWVFSHFLDLSMEWPYVPNLTLDTAKSLQSNVDLQEQQKRVEKLRNDYLLGNLKTINYENYREKVQEIIANQKNILAFFSKRLSGESIRTTTPLALTEKNLKIRQTYQKNWNTATGEKLESEDNNNGFSPYFLNVDFYPSDFLRTPILDKGGKKRGLFLYGEKELLKLTLDNYEKRLASNS